MKKMVLILFTIIFFSCEKNVDLNISETNPLLTVDAQIENDQYPNVVLTKSLGYFNNISPQLLANSFVRNAEVFVSNGVVSQKLKEYPVQVAPGFIAYFYSADLTNPATAFKGAANTNYSLRVLVDGVEYNATTIIPALNATLDSVFVKKAPQNPDTNKRNLFIRVTDPAGRGNYVRYFTRLNSGPFLAGENSVFDDQIIDGTTFDVQLSPGIDRNNPPKSDSNFFKRGDTITMKFCDISKPTYTFWNTWEFAYQSIGNPFAQPNKVLGNISNGALGAFCGYAARYRTFVAR